MLDIAYTVVPRAPQLLTALQWDKDRDRKPPQTVRPPGRLKLTPMCSCIDMSFHQSTRPAQLHTQS